MQAESISAYLSNNAKIKFGEYCWIEVCPITWYVDTSTKNMVSKIALSSGAKFCEEGQYDDNNFKDTEMYDYLNNYFAKDIIPSGYKKTASLENVKKKIKNKYNFDIEEVSEEDIIINPDVITKQSTEDDPEGGNGCIFLARRNIIIKGGSKKSSGSVVGYDYVNGFLVADGQIIIQEDSEGDGLEIIGVLAAFGSNSNDSAIVINRKLSSNNSTNPSFVVVYDPRYSKISSKFFGLVSYVYETKDGAKL